MKTHLLSALIALGFMTLPALAIPPAAVFSKADVTGVLANNPAAGFVMQTLHAVDTAGAHTSIAILRRDQSEASGLSHDHVTEIYEILEGEATLLTGGTFKSSKPMTSALDPAIGPSHQGVIEGGKNTLVKPGDLVVLAPGTPHEFSRIDGHVTYMVIRFSKEKY